MWPGERQKVEAAMNVARNAAEEIKTTQESQNHKIKELDAALQSLRGEIEQFKKLPVSDNQELVKRLDTLETWKAGLMASLSEETSSGRPRKTALFKQLKTKIGTRRF